MVSGPLDSKEVDKIHRIGTKACENQQQAIRYWRKGEPLPAELIEAMADSVMTLSVWGMHP